MVVYSLETELNIKRVSLIDRVVATVLTRNFRIPPFEWSPGQQVLSDDTDTHIAYVDLASPSLREVIGDLHIAETQIFSFSKPESGLAVVVVVIGVGQARPVCIRILGGFCSGDFLRNPTVSVHHHLEDIASFSVVEGVRAASAQEEVTFACALEQEIDTPVLPVGTESKAVLKSRNLSVSQRNDIVIVDYTVTVDILVFDITWQNGLV